MTFQPEEHVIKMMFHDDNTILGVGPCMIYFYLFSTLAMWTYGIAVPSGLFVPCITAGTAFGRALGEALKASGMMVDPGIYAFIGSTAMLGGVTRMTISLAVILLETTHNIQYLLPIMSTLLISKWIGDLFNLSLYDIHVEIKFIPFIEWEAPVGVEQLTARDVMSEPVLTFHEKESASFVYQTLKETRHHGFPVVDENGRLTGLIQRTQLYLLMRDRIFIGEPIGQGAGPQSEFSLNRMQTGVLPEIPRPHLLDFFANDVHGKDIDDLADQIEEEDVEGFRIDMRPFMNPVPYSVQEGAPLSRIFQLFRSLGIRHLPVVDKNNRVVGMCTRKELRPDYKFAREEGEEDDGHH
eukprot:CAMPEP_0115012678 /NCGR_PEP_ID=MMETSP0216-20121206/24896_1 /TAXON_ID=223996 /ORGANISM="Protocruzia adherens, Strain Boccale" /LENGTH=352 /DNA_ID=CAMNT_0002381813 /DNA_START=70 /DNA_END=1128 /DNA_ORIENTATION=+